MKKFIFTVGLPGCGKTTYLEKHIDKSYSFVSADNIKMGWWMSYPDKTKNIMDQNSFMELHHEESIEEAGELVRDLMCKGNANIIMDGGGINNHYTMDIVQFAKEHGYRCKAIIFDTPIEVCLKRMESRDRKVPVSDIYKKYQMMPRCIEVIKKEVDEVEYVNYFTNRYLFLDMDGTICSYQKPPRDIDGNVDFVNSGFFKNALPVEHILEFASCRNTDNVFILGACPNSIAYKEKLEWLNEHASFIPKNNIYFCGNKDYKHVMLKHLLIKLKLDKKDVLMIDDNYQTIDNMLKLGVNAIHPSNISSITVNQLDV